MKEIIEWIGIMATCALSAFLFILFGKKKIESKETITNELKKKPAADIISSLPADSQSGVADVKRKSDDAFDKELEQFRAKKNMD